MRTVSRRSRCSSRPSSPGMKSLFLSMSILSLNFLVHCLDDGLTVQTQQGSVSGTLVSPSVRRFLGIPYATVNRWQPPRPPPVHTSTFQATQFGDSCVQALSGSHEEFLVLLGMGGTQVSESEACLSLNIWAPSPARKQSTAVLIWIYGGGYAFGTVRTYYCIAKRDILIFRLYM